MIEHSSHIAFIAAAYAVAGAVIVAMIGAIIADYRSLRRDLSRFGARGLDFRE